MDISVIVPLYNEAESLPELEAWIKRVMEANNFSYEILFINDGSTDESWEVIKSLREKNPNVRGVCFRRNYGKSPALNTGFVRAQGDVEVGRRTHAGDLGKGDGQHHHGEGHVGGGVAVHTDDVADEDLIGDVVDGGHQHADNGGDGKACDKPRQGRAAQRIVGRSFRHCPHLLRKSSFLSLVYSPEEEKSTA